MRGLKTALGLASGAALLTACLEAQTAPDLPQRPSTEFTVTELQTGLSKPWSVAQLPDGQFLITEKPGNLLLTSGPGARSKVTGLPADIYASGQGGLLDVVLAPDFAATSEIYVSYSYGDDDANGTALLRATLAGETLENPTVIFRASPPKAGNSHFGGRIVFLPDDTLVLTLGDGFAFREDAQMADTHLGKTVRLSRSGHLARGNPFIGREGPNGSDNLYLGEIYSLGHRNVQGLAYDGLTDTLWAHEHGPRGGDELNIIEPGANYGWPLATKGVDYNGARISPYETFAGTVDAVHGWTPSIAPSGLAIYRGDMFPEWDGDALIGGLASRDLRRVDLENGKSVGEEDLLSDLEGRVRDVRIARDGAVLVLLDSSDGKLLRLTPK